MPLRQYLPSTQFILLVISLGLSAGLVLAAQIIAHPTESSAGVDTSSNPSVLDNTGWEAALYAIQAQNASTAIEPSNTPATVDQMIAAAQTPNLTDTIGRNLIINLSNAKSQGLGDDIPTQTQIISAAAAAIKAQTPTKLYSASDITVVVPGDSVVHTYGNQLIETMNSYPSASEHMTLVAVGEAVENGDSTKLRALSATSDAYRALAVALSRIPVPQTFAPLHLQVVNDYVRIAETYADIQTIALDPLRGLAGLQAYEALMDEEGRLFTNIAQDLSKDSILFNKEEAGSAWSAFVAPH